MTSLEKVLKIGCAVGFLVGMGGFVTCLVMKDTLGALVWCAIALVNQNAMNAAN